MHRTGVMGVIKNQKGLKKEFKRGLRPPGPRPLGIRPPGINLKLFLITLVCIFSTVHADTIDWGSKKNPFRIFRIRDAEVKNLPNGDQTIRLNRQRLDIPFNESLDSLFVSFDKSSDAYKTENVLKADYKMRTFEDSVSVSGSFEQPLHEMWVSPSDFLFLNQSTNTGNFSIYFRMRPYQLKRRMDVLQKAGFFEGRKQGISCGWEGGHLYYEFFNFFWNKDVPVKYLRISTRDNVQLNHFLNVLLVYKANEGSVTLYLDGVEQEKIYATSNFSPNGTILTPRFHKWDRSPIIIGKNYLGALDGLVFSNHIISPKTVSGNFPSLVKRGSKFFQKPGVVISQRIDLPLSQTRIDRLSFDTVEPDGSFVKLFYRYSDEPFSPDTDEWTFPFKELPGAATVVKGKYIQWKAELFADGAGKHTPLINGMHLRYALKRTPEAPRDISILDTHNREVTLEFLRSLDMNVVNGGRYHIYYGVKPYQPLGVIRYKSFRMDENGKIKGTPITDNDKWDTDDQRYQNRIKVTITNEMIRDNFSYFRDNPDLLYLFPELQQDVPYYFWVTACDNEWTEKTQNSDHESPPSRAVPVRLR